MHPLLDDNQPTRGTTRPRVRRTAAGLLMFAGISLAGAGAGLAGATAPPDDSIPATTVPDDATDTATADTDTDGSSATTDAGATSAHDPAAEPGTGGSRAVCRGQRSGSRGAVALSVREARI